MLRLFDCFDDVLIKPFVAYSSIVAFDVSILLPLARLDMPDSDAVLFCPFSEFATDVFGTIVERYAFRRASPPDDSVQAPDDPLCWN